MNIVRPLEDLRHLEWTECINTTGAGGTFLKARQGKGKDAVYYKLSCCDYRGVYGHESINELIAARCLQMLGISHAPCKLLHALVTVDGRDWETWLSASKSFRGSGESKCALDAFFEMNHLPGEGPLELCARFGWLQQVQMMMLADYLIANRDRHGGNIEVIQGTDGQLRLAPLFDNGLSFYYSTYADAQLEGLDPLQDISANNYLGSHSLEHNLKAFVPGDLPVMNLQESDRAGLLQGLEEAISQQRADAIWDMLWRRWSEYAHLRDSGQLQAPEAPLRGPEL